MVVLIIRCNHLHIRLPGILYSLMIMGKTSTHFNDSLLIFNNYSFNFNLQNLKLFIILFLDLKVMPVSVCMLLTYLFYIWSKQSAGS